MEVDLAEQVGNYLIDEGIPAVVGGQFLEVVWEGDYAYGGSTLFQDIS